MNLRQKILLSTDRVNLHKNSSYCWSGRFYVCYKIGLDGRFFFRTIKRRYWIRNVQK